MSSSEEEEEYEIPPLDIQIEIMKRLPVKSLIKFTSLSKSWKSIIQSSRFIADYNRHIQQPHQVFVGYDFVNYVDIFDDDDDDISFLQRLTLPPMSAEHPDLKINELIGYSQGLFAFSCYNNVSPRDVVSVVVIWNPSIRKSVFIPIPEHMLDQTDFVFTVCNATDPMIFKTTYIVGSRWQVEIFTLSTGSWRTLSNAPPRESLVLTVTGVVIDRFIHWTPEGDSSNLILSFDITTEQFTELCLPSSLAANTSSFTLGLSKYKESLVVLEEVECKQEIGVWMMMMMEPGVQNSFRKLYTVKPPFKMEFPTVIGFRKNGQPIIYYSDFPRYRKALRFYESNLEHFNDIEISGYGYPFPAGSYMETLLLLDH